MSGTISTVAARPAAIFAATLLLAGCIGGQDYATIRAEALQRGGGAEPFLVREAEAAVAARLSAEAGSVVIASITIGVEDVTMVAADPRTPGNWDTHVYASGKLRDARPVRVASGTLPGFRLGDFRALDRLPELVADARARIGFPEGELASVQFVPAGVADGEDISPPRLQVSFSDPRRGTARQAYDANGEPQ